MTSLRGKSTVSETGTYVFAAPLVPRNVQRGDLIFHMVCQEILARREGLVSVVDIPKKKALILLRWLPENPLDFKEQSVYEGLRQ